MSGAPQSALNVVLERAREYGFLGPGPIEVHFDHARAYFGVLVQVLGDRLSTARIVDLGSGGGVPGLVLAMMLPETEWLFLDSNQKRMNVLGESLHDLDIVDRCRVVCERAEESGRRADLRGAFDAVVARGFSAPPVTAECAAPLLRKGGVLVVSEPPEGEDRWPAAGLGQFGLRREDIELVDFRFFCARQVTVCSSRFPRRVGIPGSKPRF